MDVIYDQRYLDTLLRRLFSPQAVRADFVLVADETPVLFPACHEHGAYLAWAHALHEQVPPTWLGLPRNADALLLTNEASRLRQKLKKINYRLGSSLRQTDSAPSSPSAISAGPDAPSSHSAIAPHVLAWCREWLGLLPLVPEPEASTAKKAGANPIFQYLASQSEIATCLLRAMRGDLEMLRTATTTNKKLLALASCIEKGMIELQLHFPSLTF